MADCLSQYAEWKPGTKGEWSIKDAPGFLRFLLRYGLDGRDDREVVLCQLADNLEGAKCPIGRGPLGVCVETLANESLVDANQRLRAENERLRADLARVAEPYGAWPFSPACQEARAEIERLKEEVAKWQGKVARAKVEMAYD